MIVIGRIAAAGVAANTNEFIDQINDGACGAIEAKAKSWAPA
jgi:hypothetical protein